MNQDKRYFLRESVGAEPSGPHPERLLLERLTMGAISGSALVKGPDDDSWRPLAQIAGEAGPQEVELDAGGPNGDAHVAAAMHATRAFVRRPVVGVILKIAGYALFFLGLVGVRLALKTGTIPRDQRLVVVVLAVVFAAATSASCVWLVRKGKELTRRSIAEARREDPRPPVLYLRAFALDGHAVTLPDSLAGVARAFQPRIARRVTFEEFLVERAGQIGPVVTIGSPADTTVPVGAAREYVPDHEWQARVRGYLVEAVLTLIVVDDSPGIIWEMLEVSTRLPGAHTVLVLPPLGFDMERWNKVRERVRYLPEWQPLRAALVLDAPHNTTSIDAATNTMDARLIAVDTALTQVQRDIRIKALDDDPALRRCQACGKANIWDAKVCVTCKNPLRSSSAPRK